MRLLKALWNIKTCNYVVDKIVSSSIKDHTIKQKMLDSTIKQQKKWWSRTIKQKRIDHNIREKKRPCYETKNDNHVNRLLIF